MRPALALLALLVACGGDKDSAADTELDGTPDPDVNSYLPPDYVPAAPTRLIFMGDSITAGAGASSYALSYPTLLQQNQDGTWPDHGDVDLKTSFPSITEVVDVSAFGATSDSLVGTQLAAAESAIGGFPAAGETVIVVTIGGNDAQSALLPGADLDGIMANGLDNVQTMIDWVNGPGHFPDGVYVYATNIYEPTNGDGQADGCFFGLNLSVPLSNLPPFNDTLREMGEEHGMAVVDLYGHFNDHGHNAEDASASGYDPDDPSVWFAADCIHPNDRGHHEIRRLFHAAITGHPLLLED